MFLNSSPQARINTIQQSFLKQREKINVPQQSLLEQESGDPQWKQFLEDRICTYSSSPTTVRDLFSPDKDARVYKCTSITFHIHTSFTNDIAYAYKIHIAQSRLF